MVGVFSPWIYGQGKGRRGLKGIERELYFTEPPDYPSLAPVKLGIDLREVST